MSAVVGFVKYHPGSLIIVIPHLDRNPSLRDLQNKSNTGGSGECSNPIQESKGSSIAS